MSKIYYPSMQRYLLPPTSPASLLILNRKTTSSNEENALISHENDGSNNPIPFRLQRRPSVQPLFNKTMYNVDYFSKQKIQAATKLLQFISNSLLVYRGYKLMKQLNINDKSLIKNGIESFSNYNQKNYNNLIDCLAIKMASMSVDMVIFILHHEYFSESNVMIIHHIITISGISAVFKSEIGAKTLLYILWYAEVSTDFLSLSWYARNLLSNIENITNFFGKKSVQRELKISMTIEQVEEDKYNNNNNNNNIKTGTNVRFVKKVVEGCEKVLLLSFAGSFLFLRVYKYSTVLPATIKNMLQTDCLIDKPVAKYTGVTCLTGALLLTYYWGAKIVLKLKPFLVTGKVDVQEYSTNQ